MPKKRDEVLAAIYTAATVKKTTVESTPTVRPQSGVCGSLGSAFSRVRDRQAASTATAEIQAQPTVMTEENEPWEQRCARLRREGEERRAAKRRAEQAKREAAERRRQEDERRARAMTEQAAEVTRRIFANDTKAQIRELLKPEPADVVLEVTRRVERLRLTGFVPAYETILQEVKKEKAEPRRKRLREDVKRRLKETEQLLEEMRKTKEDV